MVYPSISELILTDKRLVKLAGRRIKGCNRQIMIVLSTLRRLVPLNAQNPACLVRKTEKVKAKPRTKDFVFNALLSYSMFGKRVS